MVYLITPESAVNNLLHTAIYMGARFPTNNIIIAETQNAVKSLG
ncbi:MAG: hypothetical protein ACKPKM_18015 [Dolichospermum sp.]